MNDYLILVRYRTNSGRNDTTLAVQASDSVKALQLASDTVRKRRGVVRIDSAEWRAPIHAERNPWR